MTLKNAPIPLSNEGKATYIKLVKAFPLRSIRDDAELRLAQAELDKLFTHEPLNDGEEAYLDVLSDLIEHYEEHNVPLANATDGEVLQMLMASNGLNQSQLADKISVAKSIVSELLSGKRKLNRQQIETIACKFAISKDTFSDLE